MGREQDGAIAPVFKGHTMYPDPLLMEPLHHRPLLNECAPVRGVRHLEVLEQVWERVA